MSERSSVVRTRSTRLQRGIALVFFAVCVIVPVTAALWRVAEWWRPPLPVLGSVPDFALTDHEHRPLAVRDLAGTVWVANFVFTRCRGICPALTQQMAQFARRCGVARDIRLVSFSVDPLHDTPEELQRYAASRGAVDPRWSFVTGDVDAIRHLVTRGFRLALQEQSSRDDEPIVHSDRFVLVDREGRIRGYYHALDADALEHLCADVGRVLRE